MSRQLYDTIGRGYDAHRRPDPRLAAAAEALGAAASVVNVGAGSRSYEPVDRPVVAVEPSVAMLRQRGPGAALVVRASATDLPFRDAAFGAALAVLTVHHWPDRARGLAELARVARERVVIVTWDPATRGFWLVDDYFPALVAIDREIFPSLDDLRRALGPVDVRPLLVPHDCVDGFLGAYWRGRRRTSTPACAARSPRSPGSPTWSPGWRGSPPTSRAAPGSAATATCAPATPSISATGSSSQSDALDDRGATPVNDRRATRSMIAERRPSTIAERR